MKRLLPIILIATLFSCTPREDEAPIQNAELFSITFNGNPVSERFIPTDVSGDVTYRFTFNRELNIRKFDPNNLIINGVRQDCFDLSVEGCDLILNSNTALPPSTKVTINIYAGHNFGVNILYDYKFQFITAYDSSDKFPRISDDELFEKVQKQTFKYFWDYAHPTSGLARERLGSGDTVTSGGSGFGIMCIPVGIERGWISRTDGAQRMLKIVDFLGAAERFHGAWPHWLNGSTGKAIPFSSNDNGADLVETAFLVEGLLAARAYFDGSDALESEIRSKITALWEGVEWTWFQQGGQKALYWHWSPDKGWAMNMKITSWNEAQIVYILAASSPTYPISKDVYDQGWHGSNSYNFRTPLFFVHYSFLGLDPRKLKDAYASYWEQNCQHVRTNYEYCVSKSYNGYSPECWGLTASDYYDGYTASSPSHDTGTVAPTAALASFPYAPEEAMAAMKYFYYILGDKLWGEYGFKDAFSLKENWFASSYIAIDQGPIVVMMENYRTGLLWDCFMKDPDVKRGLSLLEFTIDE